MKLDLQIQAKKTSLMALMYKGKRLQYMLEEETVLSLCRSFSRKLRLTAEM